VAYLRFASVYRQFASVDDFEAEIALLRVESEPTGLEPLIPLTHDLGVGPRGRGRPARVHPEPTRTKRGRA
jgi:transcriptional repressor NrdR